MKTMIWKELRENAKWGLLGFLGLLLAEIFALSVIGKASINDYNGLTICNSTFLLVSAFGCSAVGAALGALQILPERRRDQWASLLHRPVPHNVILLGKMTAGLILYTLASGIPLLCSVLLVAQPGRFAAPFVPGMALPACSDLLLGVVFYLAALVIGLHPGKWLGAKGAIALGAVAILRMHLSGYWPFALPLAAIVLLFAAAWGTMTGAKTRSAWISRMATALVMLAGIHTGLTLLAKVVHQVSPYEIYSYYFNSFLIADDGTVLFSKSDDKGGVIVTDSDGKEITDERYTGNDASSRMLYPYTVADRSLERSKEFFRLSNRMSRQYATLVTFDYQGPEVWYMMEGKAPYFIGYDKLSARCIGICDAEGFKTPEATPRAFSIQPKGEFVQSAPYLYHVGSQLFSVDFADRKMTPVVNVGSDVIHGSLRFPNGLEEGRIALALSEELRILNADGTTRFSLPYQHSPTIWSDVRITALPDYSRIFVQYCASFYSPIKNPVDHLEVMDGEGKPIATHSKARPEVSKGPSPLTARLAAMANLPAPTFLLLPDKQTSAARTLLEIPASLPRDQLAFLAGWAVIMAATAGVWGWRAGLSWPRTLVWAGLSLCLGTAGLIAYRLGTEWPARVRCPSCGRQRSVQSANCMHCQEAWEEAPRNGTEIFEAA